MKLVDLIQSDKERGSDAPRQRKDIREFAVLGAIFVVIGMGVGFLRGLLQNDWSAVEDVIMGALEGTVTGAIAGACIFGMAMGVGYLVYAVSRKP